MADQQQATGPLPREMDEHGPRQWPSFQVQAGLLLATALAQAAGLLLLRQLAQVHQAEGQRLIGGQIAGLLVLRSLRRRWDKAQAEDVVLAPDPLQRLFQQWHLEIGRSLQEEGLVPVMRIEQALLEEPALDRR